MVENPFLSKLLKLQQDGSEAINGPSNWTNDKPLLHVHTELDDRIETLAKEVQSKFNGQENAHWHFFVGSPGNGKSAAAGALVRKLQEQGCSVENEDKIPLEEIPANKIPYLLHVFENPTDQKKYSTIWIAQDASVVKNPYGSNVDPAKGLIDLVEDAAKHHVSLIVCTNRGVLEEASRCNDKETTGQDWFKAIRWAAKGDTEGDKHKSFELPLSSKSKYKKARVTSQRLDNTSLLMHKDIGSNLLVSATSDKNWEKCTNCSVNKQCPFYNNRGWLKSKKGSETFLRLLQNAELLSGQLIVFRELNALLSLLLAGCPIDYENGESPCSWVQKNLAKGNIFPLVARRIYMTLFSAVSPAGLEQNDNLRAKQCDALKGLLDVAENKPDQKLTNAITKYILSPDEEIASTDVGVKRLLGQKGVFSKLDPMIDTLPDKFLGRWSLEKKELNHELFSGLESLVIEIFNLLTERIESSPTVGSKHYYWLVRWYTSLSYRLGALVDNQFSMGTELQELIKVLRSIQKKDPDYQIIEDINKELKNTILGQEVGIKVSVYGSLNGEWAKENLCPKIQDKEFRENLGLPLNFGANSSENLNAAAFSWLRRKNKRGMSTKTFPSQHLEVLQDALIRTASKSEYSIQNEKIELETKLPNGKVMVIKRYPNKVIIND